MVGAHKPMNKPESLCPIRKTTSDIIMVTMTTNSMITFQIPIRLINSLIIKTQRLD